MNVVNRTAETGTIPGLMMDVPLTIRGILEHAVRNHPKREIVSRDGAGMVRYTYRDFGARVAQLANALRRMGIKPGDRVASFAWNTHRHLELYYAVPSIGAILHTANIRLFPDQVGYVIEHADDKVIFVDGSLAPALKAAIDVRPGLADRGYVTMGEATTALPNARDYETLLAAESTQTAWPDLDENAAAMLCYTSATTGDPKAALYTHRSTVIHAFATGLTDTFSLSQKDTVLPIVPQFHVNAWGLPFLTLMIGAKIVMPGSGMDQKSIIDLIEAEGVTFSAGVPTVWLAIRDALHARGKALPTLTRLVIGGSAVPPKLLDDLEDLGIRVIHAWGMTEMSPVGTVSYLKGELEALPIEDQRRKKLKQGPFSPIVQWKVLDDHGHEVAQDGRSRGELWVRGPACAASYYQNPEATAAAFVDGWFKTGDIVTWRSSTAPRISSNRAASGSVPSSSRTRSWDIPPSKKPACSAYRTRNGSNDRSLPSSNARVRTSMRGACATGLARRSRSGGCPTASCSSMRSHARASANSSSATCARNITICSPRNHSVTRARLLPPRFQRPTFRDARGICGHLRLAAARVLRACLFNRVLRLSCDRIHNASIYAARPSAPVLVRAFAPTPAPLRPPPHA